MSKITEKEDFSYNGASKVEINDGCIRCVWLECSKDTTLDEDDSLILSTGCSALIEFENGKKMIVTNSEWASLNWL